MNISSWTPSHGQKPGIQKLVLLLNSRQITPFIYIPIFYVLVLEFPNYEKSSSVRTFRNTPLKFIRTQIRMKYAGDDKGLDLTNS